MSNQPCKTPNCVGIASKDGLCAPHAAGYKQHSGAADVRCDNCRSLITKGTWYQDRDGSVHHVKACKPHPEVLKERAAKLSRGLSASAS